MSLIPAEMTSAPLTDDELEAQVELFEQPPPEPEEGDEEDRAVERRPWRIETTEQAEWAMRKLAQMRARIAEVDRLAKYWAAEIAQWADQERKAPSRTAAFFEGVLKDYGRRKREAEKMATVRLPSGSVASRKGGGRVAISDEIAVMKWAKTLPKDKQAEIIKVKESLRVSAIQKLVSVTKDGAVVADGGEIVPGLIVQPETVTFTVTPTEDFDF